MSPRFCGEFQYSPLKTALYIEKNLLPAQLKAIPSANFKCAIEGESIYLFNSLE